jgi:hypothetical protein
MTASKETTKHAASAAKTKHAASAAKSKSPLRVGNSVLIRTVTYFQLGRVVELSDTEVVLEDASWVADTGRFGAALKSGVFSEVEVFPEPVSVARGSIVDVTKWPHSLPRETK